MSQHQDHPHLDKVKTHFISGEPGTSGREPFEDTLGGGAGNQHQNVGLGQGGATAGHPSGLNTGSSHTHGTGSGLTGSSGAHTGSSHTHGTGSSGTGLTGSDGDYSTGAGTGLTGAGHQQHNANAGAGTGAAAGAGAVGIAGHGLTGLSHSDGRGTDHIGSSPSHTDKDNRGIVEKVKDGLTGGHSSHTDSHSSTHNSSTHNTSSHSTTGTGAYPASGTGTGEKRDVVDKINDALPGTPAKTEQHYGTSHNPTTQGDRTVGGGTEYGAGHHGTSGLTGAGVGAGAATAAHHHSSTSDHHSSSLGGGGLTGATGGHREHGDRVGAAGQDSSKYEGNLSSGPRTSGAAGTDRFDSSHTGAPGNVGAGLDRQHDDGVHHDTSQRAPGKSSGGIGGLLATSDKDFTGRDRQGKGAYADTDGLYKLNSTGPAGNTALTGREGNLDNNPVAQSQTRDGATPGHNVHATESTGAHGEAAHGEKKGLLAKVKDALGA